MVQITAYTGPSGSDGRPKRRRQLAAVALVERESDVDRDVLAILVLDLGFGQRALAVEAPVDRLQAAIQIALLEQLAERANLVGLVAYAIVVYGWSQSPSTPRRWKSAFWSAICSVA